VGDVRDTSIPARVEGVRYFEISIKTCRILLPTAKNSTGIRIKTSYRMIQKERLIIPEVIISVIVRKYVFMNMCLFNAGSS
jgi:hypothetical protein